MSGKRQALVGGGLIVFVGIVSVVIGFPKPAGNVFLVFGLCLICLGGGLICGAGLAASDQQPTEPDNKIDN